MSGEPSEPASRRAALRYALAAAAGGAATLLSTGCGSGGTSSGTAATSASAPPPSGEIRALNRALDLEHRTIAAYTATIPLLDRPARAAAKWFLAQELSHSASLTHLITKLGGTPIKAKPSYNLGRPKGPLGLLTLLQQLENAQVASYVAAMPKLTTPESRTMVASTMAVEAQHLAVLALSVGEDPTPVAFVTGQNR